MRRLQGFGGGGFECLLHTMIDIFIQTSIVAARKIQQLSICAKVIPIQSRQNVTVIEKCLGSITAPPLFEVGVQSCWEILGRQSAKWTLEETLRRTETQLSGNAPTKYYTKREGMGLQITRFQRHLRRLESKED